MDKTKLPPLTKECEVCKKLFEKKRTTGLPEWGRKKYCSKQCHNESKKGKPFFDSTGIPSWNKGKTGWMSEEGRRRVGEALRERLKTWTPEQRKERHDKTVKTRKANGNYKGTLGRIKDLSYSWKGDNASYNSKHKWVQKHWTKTGICENCGLSPKLFGNRKYGTEWHNKDREYNREDRGTWLE